MRENRIKNKLDNGEVLIGMGPSPEARLSLK